MKSLLITTATFRPRVYLTSGSRLAAGTKPFDGPLGPTRSRAETVPLVKQAPTLRVAQVKLVPLGMHSITCLVTVWPGHLLKAGKTTLTPFLMRPLIQSPTSLVVLPFMIIQLRPTLKHPLVNREPIHTFDGHLASSMLKPV